MTPAAAGPASGRQPWLNTAFEQAYRRVRRRYVETWLVVSGAGILLLAWPIQFLTLLPLWGPGEDDVRAFVVTMACGLVITLGLMPWIALGPFGPIILFLRGEPVDPAAVWHAAVRMPPRVSAGCTAAYCIAGNVPTVLMVGQSRDFGLSDYIGGWLVASLITSAAGFFFVLIWEVAFRPVLRDVQPLLAPDFEPGSSWLTLGRRSALASASAMAYTGAAVSSLVAAPRDNDVALAVAVLGSIASALTFGGAITALVSHSIFMRVAELNTALEQIGEREYGVRVAVRAGDELDEAAMSLNRMAERLEHNDSALLASRARLASIADGERRRMERDLRQRVLVRLQRVSDGISEVETDLLEHDDLHRLCRRVRGSVAAAEAEIHRLARGVYPAELTVSGLEAALSATAERIALPTVVQAADVGRFDAARESSVYFCCTEALQNAAKHAGPGSTASVRLSRTERRLDFEVADTGRGFYTDGAGRGLQNMRDRIRAVGGDLTIVSAPDGRGTTVSGWVPV